MKHALVKAAEDGLDNEKVNSLHTAIDEKITEALADAQLVEMHKWFCGRKEASEAASGSALRSFCDGSLSFRNVGGWRYEAWRPA